MGSRLRRALLRLAHERLRLERVIVAHSAAASGEILRRPAGDSVTRLASSVRFPRKRTVFSVRRLGSLVPPLTRRVPPKMRLRGKQARP